MTPNANKAKLHKLTPAAILAATKPGKYPDGGGLYWQRSPSGGLSGLFRHGNKWMGLGEVKADRLADDMAAARAKAEQARRLIAEGVDPIEHKRNVAKTLRPDRVPTFREAAQEYVSRSEEGWKNPKSKKAWEYTLSTFAYPVIGRLRVDEVTTGHVEEILLPRWNTRRETMTRLAGRIRTVLDYCAAKGWRPTGNNPALGRVVKQLMPKKRVRSKRLAALGHDKVPGLFSKLADRTDIPALCLQLCILTCVRPKVAREMPWGELDRAGRLWTVKPERMKGRWDDGEEFEIPLSEEAVALLAKIPRQQSPWVFVGQHGDPVSETALRNVLRQCGITAKDGSVHGTARASFKTWAKETRAGGVFNTWAGETRSADADVIEAVLAHSIGSKVEQAYDRSKFLELRRQVMAAWGKHCRVWDFG